MVSSIQKEKADLFLKYHHDKEILVLLNSWDIGSSKLIEASGYKAIATTSMGMAASLGYADCQIIQLSEMIEAITGIVNGVQVPVTVDIEAGYGNNSNEIIDSVKRIIATGIVGINIEDSIDLKPILIDDVPRQLLFPLFAAHVCNSSPETDVGRGRPACRIAFG